MLYKPEPSPMNEPVNTEEVTGWLNLTLKFVSQTDPVKANILSPEELKELKKQQQLSSSTSTPTGDPMKELSKLMGVNTPTKQDDDDDE